MPGSALPAYERACPFGWLGILSETPPVSDGLIHVNHQRGYLVGSRAAATSLAENYVGLPP